MLPDNVDALNACSRYTFINTLLVQWIKLLSDIRYSSQLDDNDLVCYHHGQEGHTYDN